LKKNLESLAYTLKNLPFKELPFLQRLHQEPPGHSTIIGQSALIEGHLVSHELVQLRGRVLGNIDVVGGPEAVLSVMPKAEVTGDIKADQASVNGVINGNIESSGRVELHANARVNGNISYSSMVIEHGAKLFGLMSPHGKN
jgi:cytoskeletal protein CcmA (bactofilin family)